MRAAVKTPFGRRIRESGFGEPGRDGQRRGHDFKRAWFAAVRNAKIKGFRFHDLRHEAVSRLVEAGLSDQEAASISGPLGLKNGYAATTIFFGQKESLRRPSICNRNGPRLSPTR